MTRNKILGVIEGFYGPPWTHEQRLSCIDEIDALGWNTYVWAAKLEPRHRDAWRDSFTSDELQQFTELSTRSTNVDLAIGLTPGDDASNDEVINKLSSAIDAGAKVVVLCFDDLPVLHAAERHRTLAHSVLQAFAVPVWIVPTHYAGVEGSAYLTALVENLHPDIEVMWTGNTVVTDSITIDDARTRQDVTAGRPPLLWDNTPVNDAGMRGHLHLGPYSGRESGLLEACSGILWNPMQEYSASLPTLHSAAAWVRDEDPAIAWSKYVQEHSLTLLAQATAYRSDVHWPGEQPARQWWESVAGMTVEDASVAPWVQASKEGAALALVALNVLDAIEPLAGVEKSKAVRKLMGWGQHRTRFARTFGAGPRVRPIATQDNNGNFVLLPASVEESESLVDVLILQALNRLSD